MVGFVTPIEHSSTNEEVIESLLSEISRLRKLVKSNVLRDDRGACGVVFIYQDSHAIAAEYCFIPHVVVAKIDGIWGTYSLWSVLYNGGRYFCENVEEAENIIRGLFNVVGNFDPSVTPHKYRK